MAKFSTHFIRRVHKGHFLELNFLRHVHEDTAREAGAMDCDVALGLDTLRHAGPGLSDLRSAALA